MNGSNPPQLALAVLEALLDAGRREAILGDLIEQYREDVAPHRNALQAWIWCWRQTTSFATWEATGRVASGFKERNPVLFWTGTIAAVQFFFTVIMPTVLGFTMQGALFALLVVSLATSALVSADFEMPWRSHGRRGVVGAFAMAALCMLTINAGLMPQVFATLVFLLFFTAGFHGAWRASNRGKGTLLAVMIGVVGSAITIPLLIAGISLGFEHPHPPLITLMPVAAGVSVVLGSMGAYAASGLKALFHWRHRTVTFPALALLSLVGCSGIGAIAELVQQHEITPSDAVELASVPFGTDHVVIRGTLSTLLSPPEGGGMIVVRARDGKKYALSIARTKDMAKQGFHRFAIGPGEEVNISAVLAKDGKMIKEFLAGRADTISKTDGKLIFQRVAPGS